MQVNFLTPNVAAAALKSINSDIHAHKNWVLTAVENGKTEYAAELTAHCRELQNAATGIREALQRAGIAVE